MKKIKLLKSQIYFGNLILINSTHPLKDEPKKEDLMPISKEYPGILLCKKVVFKLKSLLLKIDKKNLILPVSGYRTTEEQTSIFEDSIKDNGIEFTKKFVAKPACSEHQTGLAIDLRDKNGKYDFIRPFFPYVGIAQKFREQAAYHGFIERYPLGKEHITKISHEPWHFRYIGLPHSFIIKKQNLTLEEYIKELKNKPSKNVMHKNILYKIMFIPFNKNQKEIEIIISDKENYEISGNNENGCIVTLRRKI